MALPKRKISKSNRGKRRGHDSLSAPNFSVCPECGQSKLPHRICKCGYYKGEQIVTPKE